MLQENDLMFLLPKSGVHYFNLKVPFTRNQEGVNILTQVKMGVLSRVFKTFIY